MKTSKMWFVVMAAMIMSSVMFLTSCSENDEPELPEVIESEVLDEGIDNNVQSQTNVAPDGTTIGTTLSYKSWIMVKGQTRAAFENKVEVTLNNAFNNTDTVIVVPDFNLGDYTTEVSYTKRSERREGFVTVSDSVLVYTVKFDNFSFDYELDHEVAFYNDGVTKQDMPFHQIGTIKDNGYKLEDMPFLIESQEDGREGVYLRKLLKHSINVSFNGKNYTLTANVTLKKFVGVHPCIVESAIVDEGKEVLDINMNGAVPSICFKSWLTVKRSWSDGKAEEKTFTQICAPEIHIAEQSKFYRIIPDINIIRESVEIEDIDSETSAISSESEYIRTLVSCKRYTVIYNYLDVTYEIKDLIPIYDDGIIRKTMSAYSLTDISDSFTVEGPADDYTDGRPAWGYIFYQTLEFMFNGKKNKLTDDITLYIYK